MLYDGHTQAGTASLLGMALIHPVEPFKDSGLMFSRNTDAGILYRQDGPLAAALHNDVHRSVFHIVLHRIVAQILHNLIDHAANTLNAAMVAANPNGNTPLLCCCLQCVCDFFYNSHQVDVLSGDLDTFIQMTDADHILNQIHQPDGFLSDMPNKAWLIFRFYKAMLQQLRTANDSLKGSLQLMGYIGGELPAVALGIFRIGHINGQNHQANGFRSGFNPVEQEFVFPSISNRVAFILSLSKCLINRRSHIIVPVQLVKLFPHAVFIRTKQFHCGRVNTEDYAVLVQQHKTLPHIFNDLMKLVGLLLQFTHLAANFFMLLIDAVQQRGQFFISIILKRMLQPVCLVILIAIILSAVLSNRMSKKVMEPLNGLDLEHPLENDTYEEGGQLTEKVRRKPYSIVLLDEIEKAHPDVFNLLLQVMDEGRLTDSYGRMVDFKNTVIIMTSNIGTRQLKDFGRGVGFATQSRLDDKEFSRSVIQKALNKSFAPEFIN